MEVIARCSRTLPAPIESLKIGKTVGRGGFAIVKSGVLRTADGLAFPVAVKVLHPEYSDESSDELRLFKEEARLLLKMDHRNIVAAYGLLRLPSQFPGLEGHTQQAYALVLEMMEDGSLASLMVKQLLAGSVPKYTFSQALGWVIDVAKALQFLHKGGQDGLPRIHRDVKLENVLLATRMGTAKLADFGLQKAIITHCKEQRAMLVRRSQLQLALSAMPECRTGPTGLSRLASESERPTNRNQRPSVIRSVPAPIEIPDSQTSEPQRCHNDVTKLPTDAVFYTVDDTGLTPVMLPTTPPATMKDCVATPAASPLPAAHRACNIRANRRSNSLSKWEAAASVVQQSVAFSPQTIPISSQQHGTNMPGQLPSEDRNPPVPAEATSNTPPFLARQFNPSSRFPSLGAHDPCRAHTSSSSTARPSPLGPTASVSVLLSTVGAGHGAGGGGEVSSLFNPGARTPPPTSPGDAAPATPERRMADGGYSPIPPSAKGNPLAATPEPTFGVPECLTPTACEGATLRDSTRQVLPGSLDQISSPAASSHKNVLIADTSMSTETKTAPNGIGWVGDSDTQSLAEAPVSITAHVWGRAPDAAGPVKSVVAVCDEAVAVKGSGQSSENGIMDGDAQAPDSEPLQQMDLLSRRLGALGVSVRSVRNTGSSVCAAVCGTRLVAAMAAATRAGSGGGTQLAQSGAARDVGVRHRRAGSLPGILTGKIAPGGLKTGGADFEEVFTLTGRTGSLMYLAPEAYKNEPYNDKVDVYSLAVLTYELFGRTSITYTHISTKLPAFSRMLCTPDEFADRVAAGYRPPRTDNMRKMPPGLWELIDAAWHQDPVQRPDIDTVVAALEALREPLAAAEAADGGRQLASSGCSCVIS